ncbi:MAG: hypothetical protein WAV86_11645 [Lutibacter sp.]
MLEKFAKLIPQELKEKSGSVFYSGKNAFKGKKDLYILGINPGGSEILQANETIAWHTKKSLAIDSDNWSEYKDEMWKGAKPGTFGLQPRVLHLLNQLNLSPYEVPASNVCFVRSPRENNISKDLNYYIELCWPFHQKIINDLGVKVVLCFGQTAGNIVKKKLEAHEQIDEFIETNDRNWKTRVFKNKRGQIVISATHPSIADWTNPNTDPSPLVKKYLI